MRAELRAAESRPQDAACSVHERGPVQHWPTAPDQLRRARLKCAVRHAQQLESRCRRRLRQEVQERNALGAA